jgi:hypothetical protein
VAEPDDYLQGEAQTLRAVLARFESAGYGGQFAAHEGGVVHCFTCGEDSAADGVKPETIRRLEGASDPADMLAVVPITCPRCTARGTIVLNYGPESTIADSELLAKLPDVDHPPT